MFRYGRYNYGNEVNRKILKLFILMILLGQGALDALQKSLLRALYNMEMRLDSFMLKGVEMQIIL